MAKHNSTLIQIPLPIENEIFEIQLTRGYVAIVDAVDADLVEFKWQVSVQKQGRYINVSRGIKRNKKAYAIWLGRVILERKLGRVLKSGERCDHVNRNALDNRRDNLRVATHAQNMQNRKLQRNNKTGVSGVDYQAALNIYRARICINGKQTCLGYFKTLEEAIAARKAVEADIYGEFLPDLTDEH